MNQIINLLIFSVLCIFIGFTIAKFIYKKDKNNTNCVIHSTNWNGKCFKCGKQVFTRNKK